MAASSGTGNAYQGAERPGNAANHFNQLHFVAQRILNKSSTATLVQVKKVWLDDEKTAGTPGQAGMVGRVDVLPLVAMLDGYGNATPHDQLFKLAYYRLAGGKNAILLDPEANDIGLAVFADRDISSIKKSKKAGNPGSRRRFDMADGIYFGLCLGQDKPDQYVQFLKDGMNIIDKNGNKVQMTKDGMTLLDKNNNKIEMRSAGIKFTTDLAEFSKDVKIDGKLTATGDTSVANINISGTETGGGPD